MREAKKGISEHGVRYNTENEHSTMENRVMKTVNNLNDKVSQMKQSKWMLPALMALALVTALFGMTGCSPPHHM
jgi:hypothetical protein